MGKLQEDWVFIGIGLGALYLIYKATKPITDVESSAGNLVTDITDTTKGLFDSAKNFVSGLFNEPNSTTKTTTKPLIVPVSETYWTPTGYVSSMFQPKAQQQQAINTAKSVYLTGNPTSLTDWGNYYLTGNIPQAKTSTSVSQTSNQVSVSNQKSTAQVASKSTQPYHKIATVQAVVNSGSASSGFIALSKSLGLAR